MEDEESFWHVPKMTWNMSWGTMPGLTWPSNTFSPFFRIMIHKWYRKNKDDKILYRWCCWTFLLSHSSSDIRLAATSLVFQQIILATGIVLKHDNWGFACGEFSLSLWFTVNLPGYSGQWHHRVPKTCWARTPENWTIGPLDHAVPCCGFIVFFHFCSILQLPFFFRFRLPTKQTPISFGRSQDHFLHNGSRKPLHAKSGTSIFSKFGWSLAALHYRRWKHRGMFSSSSTNLWQLTRADIRNRSLTQKFRNQKEGGQLKDPHEMTGSKLHLDKNHRNSKKHNKHQ